ncbi:hypothetical protein [Paracoccus methylarcula]|uniref:hypothetical protein n=1 Tax=Paracoccus methylarcula TaxID=72022 RepID=UPI001B87D588|nr:hypothetical protein [Paracoccus methylarcula]
MSKKLKTAIVGAVIALVVGFAASYGLINQQTADRIKDKTDEILAEEETTQPAPEAHSEPAAEPELQATTPDSAEPAVEVE